MTRIALIGAGAFGKNHARILKQMPDVNFAAVVDPDLSRRQELATTYGVQGLEQVSELRGAIDAAIVATPTVTHEGVAEELLRSGIDVLIEKPIADSAEAGERLTRLAKENGRILQVGHLERFNPAIAALAKACTIPLFFEVHRLSIFTPRSLDIDVVLDLMIHDIDIVLQLTGELPQEIRAAGISILSPKVDIANVRLAFPSGCIANLTASRVSTEQVRKLRLFQPGEYLSVDYHRQDLTRLRLSSAEHRIGFEQVPVERREPLALELAAFVRSVRERSQSVVDGRQGTRALRVAEEILATIKVHSEAVSETIRRYKHS